MTKAFLLSNAPEFCLKYETSLFLPSISTVPFSTKCKCLLSGDHFLVVHVRLEAACEWVICPCLCHWCSLPEHGISSWSNSGCKCCGFHAFIFTHFVFSLCWVPGGEWQSSSVASLRAVYDAYQEHSSTLSWLMPWGMLRYARKAQRSSSKCARDFLSVCGTSLVICLQLLVLFGNVIHCWTKMRRCCSGSQVASVLLLIPNTRLFYMHASSWAQI